VFRLEAVVEPWIEGLWGALSSLFDQEANEEVYDYAEVVYLCMG